MITVKDLHFIPLIQREQLENRIRELSLQIGQDFGGKNPLFVVVLNGAFMFAAELLKNMPIACELTFIKLSSYESTGSTGRLKSIIGLDESIAGRDVIILEDIVDTGLTVSELSGQLFERGASSVEIATLLFKPDALKKQVKIKYLGFEIANRFVVGYGLDYDGAGRNLDGVFVLTEINESP